jgi:hypothetical protein
MSELVSAVRSAAVVEHNGQYRISKGGSDLVRIEADETVMDVRAGDLFDATAPIVTQLAELFGSGTVEKA